MPCRIKICGLSEESTLRAVIAADADMIGFVHFPKSPRHVSLEHIAQLHHLIPAHVQSVLVIVDPDDALLDTATAILRLSYIQLHGAETPERVAQIRATYPGQKLIKALPVSTKEDLSAAKAYEPYVDKLLFDAKPPVSSPNGEENFLPGGNGISFDWNILRGFESRLPWILSGGLTPENVQTAITQSGAEMVDVSSGVESAPGVKDIHKIQAFVLAATK